MQRSGNPAAALRRGVFDEGEFRGFTDFLIDPEPGAHPSPQAFLVHQQPGWVLRAHYHRQEQFQVALRGGGMMGRHALNALSVHYTTRESGYGPLSAGPDGLELVAVGGPKPEGGDGEPGPVDWPE